MNAKSTEINRGGMFPDKETAFRHAYQRGYEAAMRQQAGNIPGGLLKRGAVI